MIIYSYETHGVQRLQAPPSFIRKILKIYPKTETSWGRKLEERDIGKRVNIVLRSIKRVNPRNLPPGLKVTKMPFYMEDEEVYFGLNQAFLDEMVKQFIHSGFRIARVIPGPIVLYLYCREKLKSEFALIDIGFNNSIYLGFRDKKLFLHTENYGVFHPIDKVSIAKGASLNKVKKRWMEGDPVFQSLIEGHLKDVIESKIPWFKDFSVVFISGVSIKTYRDNRNSPFNFFRSALKVAGIKNVSPYSENAFKNENLINFAALYVIENRMLYLNKQ